jgi:hypothetical protein
MKHNLSSAKKKLKHVTKLPVNGLPGEVGFSTYVSGFLTSQDLSNSRTTSYVRPRIISEQFVEAAPTNLEVRS